jgi:drug/metabolite transporter (DMT)-like permease
MKHAYLKMHLAIFLWGFTGLLGKKIMLNEGMLVWYRLALSVLAILIYLLWRNLKFSVTRKEIIKISLIGFIVMLHWLTFYKSIKLANISVAMICLSSIALFSSIFEPLINKKKFDALEIFFSLMAIIGIAIIYKADTSTLPGIIVGVMSAALSALFGVFNKNLASKYHAMHITLIELSAGLLLLTLLLPIYQFFDRDTLQIPNTINFFYLLILALVCTVFAWLISLDALKHVSAFTMSLSLNLEPVYGIILAVIFANEGSILTSGFYLGAMIILLTVMLHTFYHYLKTKNAH